MLVKDIIVELQKMPQNAKLSHLWDGAARTNIEHVWLSKSGEVVTSDFNMVCYYDEDRPVSAPTSAEDNYWYSPKDPNESDDGQVFDTEEACKRHELLSALKSIAESYPTTEEGETLASIARDAITKIEGTT